jgi:O-antigen ligase
MKLTGAVPSGQTTPPYRTAQRADVATALSVFVVLLIAIPSGLVVKALGGWATPALLLALGLLLWWVVGRIVPSLRLSREFQPVRIAIGLFGASLLASYSTGFLHHLDGLQARSADRLMVFAAGLLGVALLAMDGLTSWDRLNAVLRRLVATGAVCAGLGIFSFFTGLYPVNSIKIPGLSWNLDISTELFIGERSHFRRVAGTARHPIEFGVLLAMIFPLAVQFALHTPKSRNRRWWLCVAVIGTALPMSLSRSGIIGVVTAGLVLFVSWPRKRQIRVLLAAPFYAVVMKLMIPGLLRTMTNLFMTAGSDSSITHRTNNYKRIGSLIRHQFLFGSGFGTYLPTRNEYILDNAYLGHLFETGVVGLTILLTLLFVAYFCARGARRRSTKPANRDLGQALAASIAVMIPTFFTFDVFTYPMATGTAFLLIGCAGAAWQLARRDQQAGRQPLPARRSRSERNEIPALV